MRRSAAFKFALFLLLGALINLVVAAGCALWIRPTFRPGGFTVWRQHAGVDPGKGWLITRSDLLGVTRFTGMPMQTHYAYSSDRDVPRFRAYWNGISQWMDDRDAILAHDLKELALGHPIQGTGTSGFIIEGVGWPWRTLRSRWSMDARPARTAIGRSFWHEAISLSPSVPESPGGGIQLDAQRALPLRPIWPGVAANSLFYAAILWLIFGAPGTVRRWRRARRGLCPHCGYPIGTSDVCTECGRSHPLRQEQVKT